MEREKKDRALGPYWEPERGRWFVLLIRADGARVRRRFASEAAATKYRQSAEAELAATAGQTIAQALEKHADFLRQKGGKEHSIADTIWKAGRLFPNHQAPVASFRGRADGKALYKKLLDYRKENGEPYAADSQRNMLIQARTFYRWMVDEGHAKVNIFEGVMGIGERITGQDKSRLTVDEAGRFGATALDWYRRGRESGLAVLVGLFHGCRAHEITRRQVRDIDEGGAVLHIRGKTRAGTRTVVLALRLRPLLQRQIRGRAATDYIFGDGDAARWPDWIRKNTQKICKAAGVPIIDAHGLRRTWATLKKRGGASDEMIEEQIGHAFITTANRSYIKRGTSEEMRQTEVADVLEGALSKLGKRRPAARAPRAAENIPGVRILSKIS